MILSIYLIAIAAFAFYKLNETPEVHQAWKDLSPSEKY